MDPVWLFTPPPPPPPQVTKMYILHIFAHTWKTGSCIVWLLSMHCVAIVHVFVWLLHSVAIVQVLCGYCPFIVWLLSMYLCGYYTVWLLSMYLCGYNLVWLLSMYCPSTCVAKILCGYCPCTCVALQCIMGVHSSFDWLKYSQWAGRIG